MKIKINNSVLQKTLNKVNGVTSSKNVLAILSHIYIKAANGKLTLVATNLDLTLKTIVDCEVLEEGEATVPMQRFMGIIGAMPPGDVEIAVDASDKMLISEGATVFRLAGLSASAFPAVAEPDSENECSVNASDFTRLFRRVAFAQCADDTRKVLESVLLEVNKTAMRCVATNGRVLAFADLEVEWKGKDTQVIIPSMAVSHIQRLAGKADGEVNLFVDAKNLKIEFSDGTTVYSKLHDGVYPNYKVAVPKDSDKKIKLVREELVNIINRMLVIASDDCSCMELSFSKNTLKTNITGKDEESADDKMPIKYDGEELVIYFDVRILANAMKAMDADEVELEAKNEGSAIVVKGIGETGLTVIMPLRKN